MPKKKSKIYVLIIVAIISLFALLAFIIFPRIYISNFISEFESEEGIPERFELNDKYVGEYVEFEDLGIYFKIPVYDANNKEIVEIRRAELDFKNMVSYEGNSIGIILNQLKLYEPIKFSKMESIGHLGASSYDEYQFKLLQNDIKISYFKPVPLIAKDTIDYMWKCSNYGKTHYTIYQKDNYSFVILTRNDDLNGDNINMINIDIIETNQNFKPIAGLIIKIDTENSDNVIITNEDIAFIVDSIVVNEID